MPVDQETLDAFQKMLVENNKAQTAAFDAKFAALTKAAADEKAAAAAAGKSDDDAEDEDDEPAAKPAKGKGKRSVATKENDARIAALEAKAAASEQRAKEANERETHTRVDGAMRSALDEAGIPPARHGQAIAWLRTLRTEDGQPVVAVDASGNPTFRTQRKAPGGGSYVDELPVAAGIREWADTDDGKGYRPASGVQGTGERAGANSAVAPKGRDGKVDWNMLGKRIQAGIAGAEVA